MDAQMAQTSAPGGDPRLHHFDHAAHHEDPAAQAKDMEKPTLHPPNTVVTTEEDEHIHDVATMLKKFGEITAPTVVSNVLWFSIFAVSQMFVGHRLGGDALAKMSIGISVFNAVGQSVCLGMCAALDTLVAQAFGRDPTSKEMGELLQRGIAVNSVMWLIASTLFFFSEPTLVAVFGETLGEGAYDYLWVSPLMLLGILNLQAFFKSLQAQNVAELPLVVNVFGAVINPFYNYMFTDSIQGSVLSMTLTAWSMLVFVVILSKRHKRVVLFDGEWPAPNLLEKSLVREYMWIGIPSLMSLCAEWWAFELLQVVASHVSVHAVSVFSVVVSIAVFAFSSPLGISIASSVTIGNSLGANEPELAKKYAKLGVVIGHACTFVVCSVIVWQIHPIASAYTDDPKIVESVSKLAFFVAAFHAGDSTQFVLQGIFRGAGQQAASAKVCIASLWLVGVPAPYILAIHFELGVRGVILGLICGFCVEVPLMLYSISKWDWAEMAFVAAKLEVEEAKKCVSGNQSFALSVSTMLTEDPRKEELPEEEHLPTAY